MNVVAGDAEKIAPVADKDRHMALDLRECRLQLRGRRVADQHGPQVVAPDPFMRSNGIDPLDALR